MRKEKHCNAIKYIEEVNRTLKKINYTGLQDVINFLKKRNNYGKVFTVGNGGSASTAEHMVSDLNKWSNYGCKQERIRAYCLNSNMPEISALTNDVGWANLYTEILDLHASSKDVLLAYSVHGGKGSEKAGQWSTNISGAIEFMNEIGGTSIGITGCDGGVFKEKCNYCIVVASESTPIVEGLHAVVSHIICDGIRKL